MIDTEIEESPKDVILGIMSWWEKKRWIFNVLILGLIIFVVGKHLMEYPNREVNFGSDFFYRSFFYFIFINICYSAGWGIKLLVYYYFNIQSKTKAFDLILFVVGTLFTGLVTYDGYRSYLIVSNYF